MWIYYPSLLQLSIIITLIMLSLIIILVLSIRSLFTLWLIYWRFTFVLSPGEGLNRRPSLHAIDTQGPRRAVFDPDAAGINPGGAGPVDHNDGPFIVCLFSGIISLNSSLTKK